MTTGIQLIEIHTKVFGLTMLLKGDHANSRLKTQKIKLLMRKPIRGNKGIPNRRMKTSFHKSVIVQVHYDKSNSTLVLYQNHRDGAISMKYYYYYRKNIINTTTTTAANNINII